MASLASPIYTQKTPTKFLMKKFKIEEIDYDKFKKENMWAIRPEHKDKDP